MQHQRDRYTRFISIVKIALPFLAICLVVSIFLFSNSEDNQAGLVVPDREFESLAVGQKITGPVFSGLTRDGDAFSLTAEYALPDAPRPLFIDLANTKGSFNFKTGLEVKSSANKAQIDVKKNAARLIGQVSIQSSDGFNGSSQELLLNFAEGSIESPGPVEGITPFGNLNAGSMIVTKINQEDSSHLMFQNGVNLVYLPKQQE